MTKSTDGANWEANETFPLAYSVTGPVSVSYWTGYNMLMTVQ